MTAHKPPARRARADSVEELLKSRFYDALHNAEFEQRFTSLSTAKAVWRLFKVLTFTALSYHMLYLAPTNWVWVAWCLVAVSMIFLNEIGQDCYSDRFFPHSWLNNLVYYMCAMPLVHIPEQKVSPMTPQSEESGPPLPVLWHKRAFGDWSVLAAIVLPGCVYYFGLMSVSKYWLVPCLLFHAWMFWFAYLGRTLRRRMIDMLVHEGRSSSTMNWAWVTWQSLLRHTGLRAVLHSMVKIPSYRISDAMTAVYRMWNRKLLDGADIPPITSSSSSSNSSSKSSANNNNNNSSNDNSNASNSGGGGGGGGGRTAADVAAKKKWQHENMAVGAFKRGLQHFPFLDWGTRGALFLLTGVWVYTYVMATNNVVPVTTVKPDGTRVPYMWSYFRAEVAQPVVQMLQLTLVESSNAWLNWLILIAAAAYILRSFMAPKPVYLMDFVTFTGDDSCKVSVDRFREMQAQFPFSDDALKFMDRLIERTGLGQDTYFPPHIMTKPPDFSMQAARQEAELVMFTCLDELFATTQMHPRKIDILVVNCSLFCPTPSLASMVVRKYGMREDIESYNLGGMGCSAGVISIHLVKQLLQARPNSTAVVVSMENITQNWYMGEERSMLVANCLFRMGGAAILLSNKASDRSRSKYQLLHSIRTHRGSKEEAYQSVYQDVDNAGITGVRLSKELMKVAGDALKSNLTTLGPLILPWTEQAKFLYSILRRWLHKRSSTSGKKKKVKVDDDNNDNGDEKKSAKPPQPYVPDFKTAVDHFCIHAGGRAVVDAIQEALRLSDYDVEPSRNTLFRYGNTSSSSIWYELAFLERMGRVEKSHKVWQIAFGSGFKCNSAVWQAIV